MLTKPQWLTFQRMALAGHQWSPEALEYTVSFTADQWTALNTWPDELWESSPFATLEVTDRLTVLMTQSWQEWHTVTLQTATEQLIEPTDDRPFVARKVDGIMGPVTIHAAHEPRCGCPDYRNPNEAVAEGNWRPECRGSLSWALKDGGFSLPGLTQEQVTQAFELAYEYHHRAIEGVKFVRDDSLGTRANTFSRPARLGGSTLARHTLPPSTGTACSFSGWGEYSTDKQWQIAYLICVIIHEEGHGLGCDHVKQSSGGVMTPGINSGAVERVRQWIADKATAGAFNTADWQELTSKGYTQRTTPPDDPDPPVPPTPVGKIALQGRVTAVSVETGEELGEFILVTA